MTLQDGTTITGEVVGINARWVVIDTGAKVITLRRAEITSLGEGLPPSLQPAPAPPAFSAPGRYPAVTKTREPPRDRIHQGAFFALGILPRFLALEACSYAIGTNCVETVSESGYAVAGSLEFGYSFRKRFLLALASQRAGFGGRLGFGYEVKVARNFTFAPALTATGMIGPSTTGRITVDGQIAVRRYF